MDKNALGNKNGKKLALTNVIRIGIAAVGAAVLIFGVYKVWKPQPKTGPQAGNERVAQMLKQDKANLSKADARDFEIHGALLRLSQRGDQLGRTEAIKRAKSESAMIRQGVANALGYFEDDESFTTLKSLLGDKEQPVRVHAIYGLGHKRNKNREDLLQELLKKKDLAGEERIAVISSLLRVVNSPELRNEAVGTLLSLAKDTKNPTLSDHAVRMAVSMAPRDQRVTEMLRGMLNDKPSLSVEATAVRHLATTKDPWVRKHLRQFAESKSPQTRLAVVQSLHVACPDDRWSLLEKIVQSESDRSVLSAALRAPGYMPGDAAKSFMERVTRTVKLEGDAANVAKNTSDKLKGPGVDPCQAQKKLGS
jgi:hypothetical protein